MIDFCHLEVDLSRLEDAFVVASLARLSSDLFVSFRYFQLIYTPSPSFCQGAQTFQNSENVVTILRCWKLQVAGSDEIDLGRIVVETVSLPVVSQSSTCHETIHVIAMKRTTCNFLNTIVLQSG
jgi:hypothetical protein